MSNISNIYYQNCISSVFSISLSICYYFDIFNYFIITFNLIRFVWNFYRNFSLFILYGFFIIIIIISDVCIWHFFFLDNCFDLYEGFRISYFSIYFLFIFRVIVKVLHLNGCILVNLYLFSISISISILYVSLVFIFIFISYNLLKQISFTLVLNLFRHCWLFILSFFFIFIYLFIYLLNDLFILIVI